MKEEEKCNLFQNIDQWQTLFSWGALLTRQEPGTSTLFLLQLYYNLINIKTKYKSHPIMQAVSPAWSGAPPQITVNIALSIDVMIADHLMAPATVLSQGAPPAPGDGDPLPWSWHLR